MVRRARTTSSETSRRSSRRITASAVCFARPEAAPKAMPAVAAARAGASLIPSPIIMTPPASVAPVPQDFELGLRVQVRVRLIEARLLRRTGDVARPDRRTGARPPYRATSGPRSRRAPPAAPGPRARSRRRAGRRFATPTALFPGFPSNRSMSETPSRASRERLPSSTAIRAHPPARSPARNHMNLPRLRNGDPPLSGAGHDGPRKRMVDGRFDRRRTPQDVLLRHPSPRDPPARRGRWPVRA